MKSDFEETDSISFIVDASDGTSTHETFSFQKSEDESSSPKMSARNEVSEISLSTKSFSMPSSIVGLAPFDGKDNKSPTRKKTTSELEEKCHDNYLSERYIKSDNEEIYSKSYVADASHETSRKEVSSYKMASKPPERNVFAITEFWKTANLEKPFSRFETLKRPLSFNVKNKHSSTSTNIFSDNEEMYRGGSPSKKRANFECEETRSQFSISDVSDRISPLQETPSGCELKDRSLLESRELFRSKALSMISDAFIDINADNESLDHSEAQSLQDLAFHIFASEFQPSDESIAPWSKRDETTDAHSFTESFSKALLVSSDFQTDNERPEHATPCPHYDDSSSSSSSSSVGDYYDDDEDIQRFCLQDMRTLQDQVSYNEAFKNEIDERPNSIESDASSDRNCGTPFCQFMLKEVESYEGSLLMKVQEFFSENPQDDTEIMSRQESINSIITSSYFTDEFAQQHGLTVSEKGVDRIGNELEDDTDERVKRRSSEPNSCLRYVII